MATHRFIDHPAPLALGGRARLLAALGLDLLALLALLLAAGGGALLWLLARTDAGRLDVAAGDGAGALAVATAALPAWAATEWFALLRAGRSLGALGMALDAARPPRGLARVAWLLLHPVSTALWCWAAASAALLDAIPVAVALVAVGALVLLLGGASLLRLLLRPAADPLHATLAHLVTGGR